MAGQKVRNVTRGFRGLNTKDGGYLELGPGQLAEGVELDDAELESAKRTGYFAFGKDADSTADAAAALVASTPGAAPATPPGGPLPRNVTQLKKIARDEGIDVGDAKSADDLTAVITAGRAAKAAGGIPPINPGPSDDLDNMSDDDLRTTVAALTGKPATDYATTERDELLRLAREDR
jgi:hypothetical protein